MGLVQRSTKSAGGTGFSASTTASAAEVNTDFDRLYNEVNGNLDDDNLASSLDNEHNTPGGDHKLGSARAFRQNSEPSNNPAGTALAAGDAGRVLIRSDLDDQAFVWDGSAFALLAAESRHATLANRLINGSFELWQRGTAFAGIGAGDYTADRWRADPDDGAATVTRRDAGGVGLPETAVFYYEYDQTGSATSAPVVAEQRVENVRTFADEDVVVSFQARADAARTVSVVIEQFFGSGGTASATVTSTPQTASVTTSWQTFTLTFAVPSLSGKTVDGADHSFRVRLSGPSGAAFRVDLWGAQLQRGVKALPFRARPIGIETALAQRYYWQTTGTGTAPANGASTSGRISAIAASTGAGGVSANVYYPVEMRSAPAVSTFTPVIAGSGGWRRADNTEIGASVSVISSRMFVVLTSGGSTDGSNHEIFAAADAEL